MSNANKYIHLLILCLGLAIHGSVTGQTPGMIIKPATGAGAGVLDPDGDGYVSQKTNGIQLGFTTPPGNDVFQSEIPYVAIIRPDPLSDILRGPTGGFCEIVGVDAAGNNAILVYKDLTNIYFRFRLGGYAPNSKSYSLLIDTDGKFGFTGINADPHAISGNPGFEAEITLETNFNVKAFNVDGIYALNPQEVESKTYETNCQKSIAASTASGDADYFYDFYLPLSSLTTLFTSTTPLRIVAVTVMNPNGAIGNNALSDVGGVTTGRNIDQIFTDLIEAQTPTIPGQEVLDRTACPSINSVGVGDPTISGTTVSGATVIVYMYHSNGTLLGSGTAITTGTTWSISKDNIKNASNTVIPLVSGYKVRATATAAGMGASYDNCDIETVTNCVIVPVINASSITSDTKGISGAAGAAISGATIKLYNASGSVVAPASGSGPYIVTVATNGSFLWKCDRDLSNPNSGSGCLNNGQTYFVTQTINGCESQSIPILATCTTSNTPAITTSSITIATTSISGTGLSGSIINIYSGTNQIATGIVNGTNNWVITIPEQPVCSQITARQIETGKCLSLATAIKTVTRTAITPSIDNTAGCSASIPTTISGISTEIGATIRLYKSTDLVNAIGSATVVAGGTWTTVSTISPALVSGDIIKAKVATAGCFTESPLSDPVPITTQTNISAYTITFDPVTEKRPSVSGTITGGSGSVTLRLYVDEAPITYIDGGVTKYRQVIISTPGSWTISDLEPYDLGIGSTVRISVTATSACESALSSSFATVQCIPPLVPAYTGGSKSYCIESNGTLALSTSELGVIYQLVNGTGVAQGLTVSGTGLGVNLYTNIINTDLTGLYVKAYKFGNNACAVTSSSPINFDTESPSPSVTFGNTDLSVVQNNSSATTVNLTYTSPISAASYSIAYSQAAINKNFQNVSVRALSSPIPLTVPVSTPAGTYAGTITIYSSDLNACTKSYSFTITVYVGGSAPFISAQPISRTICPGTTSLTVDASGDGTLTYQWQSSATLGGTYTNIAAGVGTGATTDTYTTATLATTTYYKVIVTNTNGSVTSNISTVTINPTVSGTGTISGATTVCAGQNSVSYSVAGISNATSYTWSYTPSSGVIINGTGSSVYINFGANATTGVLSVTGTNSCGPVSTATRSIIVNPLPTVNAGVDISICSTASAVNFSSVASASNYNSVAWTSSGTAGTITNPSLLNTATYTPSAGDKSSGSITLTLTATNSCGTATSTKTLTITPAPVATAGSDISICTGTSAITMTGATATGTYTGNPTWSGGTGTWVQNANPALATFTPTNPSGSFTATLTLSGCVVATSTRQISWGTAPTPTFIAAATSNSCVGNSVIYTTQADQTDYTWTITGTSGADYSIMAGDIATNSITIKWLSTGSKTVTVNYKANGCLGTTAASNTTTVHAKPNPSNITIN